jgi:hypothetical protein
MRSVNDIVGAVQEQQPATDEELRLALLCLYYDNQLATPHDFGSVPDATLRMRAKENFERRFRMMRAEPDKYLGDRYTPGTAENSAERDQLKRILAAFEKRKP